MLLNFYKKMFKSFHFDFHVFFEVIFLEILFFVTVVTYEENFHKNVSNFWTFDLALNFLKEFIIEQAYF